MSSSKNRKKKAKRKASNGHINAPDSQPSLSCEAAEEVHKLSTFKDELAWCLNQLQIGMQSSRGDINKQMKTSYEKNYRSLMSAKTPLPRKRQLMRSLFGDYRSKLKSHPVIPVRPSHPGMAAMKKENTDTGWRYFKSCKSPALKADQTETVGSDSIDKSSFSFDFDITSDMLKD